MGSGCGRWWQLFITGGLYLRRDNGESRTRARINRETVDIAWRVALLGKPCPCCFVRVDQGLAFYFFFIFALFVIAGIVLTH